MTSSPSAPSSLMGTTLRDFGFAIGMVLILTVLFVPIPALFIDVGLSFSIAFSILILMVALWINKPLDFSAFPTILLVATMLRLSLNVATTRLILTHGHEGSHAAGYVIGGFSDFVMGGDFVIGVIVFIILVTVNFVVITKGATRIAEVGARFMLDAIPGKQMAIDADLSAGLMNEQEARRRRSELEEESSFFGSMDGASKFVRGDAIAGLIITVVNILGGTIIGVTRHGLSLAVSGDVYVKLAVGDGLVTQIPALIVSLAAGLLVSKGGNEGSVNLAIFDQLSRYPRALMVSAALLFVLALMPSMPFLPFACLGGVLAALAYRIPKKHLEQSEKERVAAQDSTPGTQEQSLSLKDELSTPEIELVLGKQISAAFLPFHAELAHRTGKMRRKFARQYGFVVPEIKLCDDLSLAPKGYQIKIHGTVVASDSLRIGEVLLVLGEQSPPDLPGDLVLEPAFGLKAFWISEVFEAEAKRLGYAPIDAMSALLTHVNEVIRNNLSQLLSYRDVRALIDRLPPEYRKLVDDLCPAQLSFSALQAVLKLLLSERVSIRNLHLILESIAEVAPHMRRPEAICEHVRLRMAQQICGDLTDGTVLKVLRLGPRWDLTFHQSLKRDNRGDIIEFDIDPRLVEQFAADAKKSISDLTTQGHQFVLVTTPEARPYVRMMVERLFPTLPVLSHVEIARGVTVEPLGAMS